jgi:hypothetical protein
LRVSFSTGFRVFSMWRPSSVMITPAAMKHGCVIKCESSSSHRPLGSTAAA